MIRPGSGSDEKLSACLTPASLVNLDGAFISTSKESALYIGCPWFFLFPYIKLIGVAPSKCDCVPK